MRTPGRAPERQSQARRQYFEAKKQHLEKRDKTIAANSKALRHVEARTAAALSKAEAATGIRAARTPHWFEKFNWFVTSEGYLVVSGRDAPQDEMLLRRCAPAAAIVLLFFPFLQFGAHPPKRKRKITFA